MATPSDRLLLADARAVIGTVSEHLFFFVVIKQFYLASAVAKTMAAIHKVLGSRLAEVVRLRDIAFLDAGQNHKVHTVQ
ncbi:hypothetical protein KVQ82_11370 [Pseudomonas sp. AO-1]|uniref:hypothetical protein n=1 Tax=Pseudomonas sp. AO-1 TaxID=2855434 RepID=UPI001C7909BB|nr:hypothetical protein [Pseudomonas sp. AO-1]QXZ16470.1 hypothetical protein KVQ82_11370 [Pseudomonas sp. AO-1]